jgi:hypothetical protein
MDAHPELLALQEDLPKGEGKVLIPGFEIVCLPGIPQYKFSKTKTMKKMKFTLCIPAMLVGLALTVTGQNLITETFDTYTAGQQLVAQGAPNWTTWSNLPGSNEDPFVSNAQSFSTPNSVKITGTNDAVLLLNDKTTGRYILTYKIYVPSGKLGYYNILQDFAGANSKWGTQTYLDDGGWGHIDAGGADAGEFTFSYNQWFEMHTVIDLGEDWAHTYYEDEVVVEWQWSTGAFGTNNTLKLDGTNLYAWTGTGGSPECYFDNILFDQVPAPAAPMNLTADVTNFDVFLEWEIPGGATPVGYRIYRDGEYIGYSIPLSYWDLSVYPGDHTYFVRADYGNEISAPSNDALVTVAGGTDRQFVLLEIATGTWCQYCPGAAMGADELVQNGNDVAVVEYHQGDSYEIPDAVDRIGYYGITGFPTAEFDGVEEVVGGSTTTSMYSVYLPIYQSRIAISSLFICDLTVDWADVTNVVAHVTVEKIFDYTGNIYLRMALTESNIPEVWFGLTEVDYVCRAMFPDANGTLVDFSSGNVQTFDVPISIPDTYVWDNLELVAWLQDEGTMEVLQADWFPMTQTVVPGSEAVHAAVSPNPVQDNLKIRANADIRSITVYNSLGVKVKDIATDTRELNVNTSTWKQGLYVVEIRTDEGTATKKVLKK